MFDLSAYADFFGGSDRVIYLDEVDSTNTYAVKNDFKPFTCVVSGKQTAGRGRSGRKWHSSSDENLYFSVVLEGLKPVDLLPLNIFAGYVLSDTLKELADVKIKWPNDMTVSGKKLAGILMETSFSGSVLEKVVLGIGLNVNCDSFDNEIKEMATSLKIETGEAQSRELILASFMKNLENSFDDFLSGKIDIVKLWSAYSAFLDKRITIHKDGLKTPYVEKGIDSTGCLRAVDESGKLQTIVTGDIGYDFCR